MRPVRDRIMNGSGCKLFLGAPMRILLVDDEPLVLRTIQRGLRQHAVTSAGGGAEALALIRRGATFDVILCDLNMPTMSGRTLYETVFALLPELARRMVFTTGGALNRDDEDFLATHATVTKPFGTKELETLLASIAVL